jgi:hypothetical protein
LVKVTLTLYPRRLAGSDRVSSGLLVSAGMAATIPMQIVYAGERFAAAS